MKSSSPNCDFNWSASYKLIDSLVSESILEISLKKSYNAFYYYCYNPCPLLSYYSYLTFI